MSTSETRDATTDRPADELVAIPVRHPGRWVAAAVVVVLLAMLVHSLFANPRWEWGVVGDYLFDHTVVHAVLVTLELTVLAMAIGIVGGILLAVARLSKNPVVSGASWFYIQFFRGTPILVQLLFWGYISAIFPRLTLGIPFGPAFVHFSANSLISLFTAAVLGLGLNEAAYMAEIVRAGLLSVDSGQTEAAHSLGMTSGKTMRRIVLPQAMRVVVPPTGNETISMLKTTSLVIVLGLTIELLGTVQLIYGRTYQTIPMLIVASLWYLFLTSILTLGQYYVERYYGRGSSRALPQTPWQKVRGALFTTHRAPAGVVDVPVPPREDHR
ncbi:MAG: polar amino acid transport system permease protein [Frankiales bacterium]|nr:polar amino acid transport system permease protein [Frankiales bacterium]